MIDLFTAATPNGRKISIMLEEIGLAYTVHHIDLGAGQQKLPEFLAMNPNGRIPVIVDRDNDDFVVFESGAILMYLAEKTGQTQLSGQDYLCDDYSIADIAHWCWAAGHEWSGIDITHLDHLRAWIDRVAQRPAVARGREVPKSIPDSEMKKAGEKMIMR